MGRGADPLDEEPRGARVRVGRVVSLRSTTREGRRGNGAAG